jgi:hypothetical protein
MNIPILEDVKDLSPEEQYGAAVMMAVSMKERAEALIVDSEERLNVGTAIWKDAKEMGKHVEAMRKKQIDPLRKIMAAVNDKSKGITDSLEEAEAIIKRKTSEYQLMLDKKREAEIERSKEVAKVLGDVAPVFVPQVDKTLRGDGVVAYTKTEKKFRIKEALEVPRQFLKVDEAAIELAIKQGCTQIPGIEMYEEQKTILRSR